MAGKVLLVHGAWHGAWCWDRVVPMLAAADVRAVAVDLPGHGADTGVLGDLHLDAARVRDEVDRLGRGVVLVGHSYGGAVITEAGNHPAVDHLVYLAAFALDDGESCVSVAMAHSGAGAISHEGRPNLGTGMIEGDDGSITLDPAVAAECLYNTCDGPTVAWALSRLGPQPLETLQQTPETVAWRRTPSTYVVCTEDLGVHPDLQRVMARRCGTVVEWPTDHSPFLSRPDLVADLLVTLASHPD